MLVNKVSIFAEGIFYADGDIDYCIDINT
jgi:hypothetical protein